MIPTAPYEGSLRVFSTRRFRNAIQRVALERHDLKPQMDISERKARNGFVKEVAEKPFGAESLRAGGGDGIAFFSPAGVAVRGAVIPPIPIRPRMRRFEIHDPSRSHHQLAEIRGRRSCSLTSLPPDRSRHEPSLVSLADRTS